MNTYTGYKIESIKQTTKIDKILYECNTTDNSKITITVNKQEKEIILEIQDRINQIHKIPYQKTYGREMDWIEVLFRLPKSIQVKETVERQHQVSRKQIKKRVNPVLLVDTIDKIIETGEIPDNFSYPYNDPQTVDKNVVEWLQDIQNNGLTEKKKNKIKNYIDRKTQ